MTFRSSLIWFLASSCLLIYIWFFENPFQKSASQNQPDHRLFPDLDLRTIDEIELQQADKKLRLQKEKRWQIVDPIAYPAEPAKVQSLIEGVAELEFESALSPIDSDADLYGFKKPSGTITLKSTSQSFTLVIGKVAGNLAFIQRDDSQKVFAISRQAMAHFKVDVDAWRDPRLLPYSIGDIREIAIETALGKAVVSRKDARADWTMSEPLAGARLDASFIPFLLQQLSEIRIAEFTTKKALPLQISIRLGMKDANAYEIQIQTPQEKNPSLAWGYLPKSQTGIAIPKALAEQIADPQRAFRSPYLLDPSFSFDTIEHHGQEKFTISKDPKTGIWWINHEDRNDPFRADDRLMDRFLRQLSELRITNFIADRVDEEDRFGIDFPFKSLHFKLTHPADADAQASLHLRFGFKIENQLLTHRSDEPSIYAVPFGAVVQLPDKAYQLRHRKLWNLKPESIRQLRIQHPQQKEIFWRRHQGRWTRQGQALGEVESAAFDELIAQLCQASAEDWTHRGEAAKAQFGIGSKGIIHISSLNRETEKTIAIEFGARTPRGHRYAATHLDGEMILFEFPAALFVQLSEAMFASSP